MVDLFMVSDDHLDQYFQFITCRSYNETPLFTFCQILAILIPATVQGKSDTIALYININFVYCFARAGHKYSCPISKLVKLYTLYIPVTIVPCGRQTEIPKQVERYI